MGDRAKMGGPFALLRLLQTTYQPREEQSEAGGGAWQRTVLQVEAAMPGAGDRERRGCRRSWGRRMSAWRPILFSQHIIQTAGPS